MSSTNVVHCEGHHGKHSSSQSWGDGRRLASRRRARGQAEILEAEQLFRTLDYLRGHSLQPEADELKVLLSFKAGLRAGEIATIDTGALLDADGRVRRMIELRADWTKGNRSRQIPMHPDLREAVKRFQKRFPGATHIAIRVTKRGIRRQSANALCQWFSRLYGHVGFTGCSSHSGRRTFVTELARRANLHRASLRDVQLLAGHARLDTTERYIQPSSDLAALVASL